MDFTLYFSFNCVAWEIASCSFENTLSRPGFPCSSNVSCRGLTSMGIYLSGHGSSAITIQIMVNDPVISVQPIQLWDSKVDFSTIC